MRSISKKEIKEMATKLAMSLENIKEEKCARDVLNPGIYFGAMLVYNELKKQAKETNEIIVIDFSSDEL